MGGVERAMASGYEFSAVFNGQSRLMELGFRQGSPARDTDGVFAPYSCLAHRPHPSHIAGAPLAFNAESLRPDRSDRRPSPWPMPPRSPSRTSLASRHS